MDMDNINYNYGDKYYGETKNGKRHGFGKLALQNGQEYTGNFEVDAYHGTGTLCFKDGRKFIGEFVRGSFNRGIIIFPDGDVCMGEFCELLSSDYDQQVKQIDISPGGNSYVGEYLGGEYYGSGTLTVVAPYKEKYIGEFSKGKKTGNGILYSEDQREYVGEFNDDKITGPGILTFPNGEKYMGELLDEEYHGIGSLILSSGQKYMGEFTNGERTGNGVLIYTDGRKLIGEFKNGTIEGAGIFVPPVSEKYVGEYKNGQRNGKGILIYSDGRNFIGEFKNGARNGLGIFSSPSGEKYIGEYENGQRNGKGTLIYSIGNKYEGEFKNGKREGYGILSFTNGETYDGKFKADKYNGNGILIKVNGDIIEGEFADGNFVSDKIGEDIIKELSFHKRRGPLYLFVDTETTGLPKDSLRVEGDYDSYADDTTLNNWPRLVRLSYIIQDSNGAEIVAKDFIIRPVEFTIPISASRIHGITTERAKKEGMSLKSVLKHFRQVYDYAANIIGHNIYFDEKVIAAEFMRNNMQDTFTDRTKFDTMGMSIDFCAIKGHYGYKYPTLSELHYKLFANNFDQAHNSRIDVAMTSKCFWELKRRNIP